MALTGRAMSRLAEIQAAAEAVHAVVSPTPQYCWPLLAARCGCEVWVKHENYAPTGAFKVRGGLIYLGSLSGSPAVIAATRGNHGQSIAFAARYFGLRAVVVVPAGNSPEKNTAIRGYGAELVVHGQDFQEAFEYAVDRAQADGLHLVPSFDPLLVRGVATYGLELLTAVPDLDVVYVPIGLGSGICALIQVRDALGLGTRIVGVVAAGAPSYALSFEAGRIIATDSADTVADGLACSVPVGDALACILRGAERVIRVTDDEIAAAVRVYFTDTHSLVEGAGAAALAGLLQERERLRGLTVGVIASGGNIDMPRYNDILSDMPATRLQLHQRTYPQKGPNPRV